MEAELDPAVEGAESPVADTGQADNGVIEAAAKTDADDESAGAPEKAHESPDDPVYVLLDRLDARLGESQRLLDRQSDLVDKLHAENQKLRAGELRDAQLPLVRDLLRLHDDVERMRGATGDADDLRVVQECLIDTLARNGIEPFAPDHEEAFDPRLHSASGVEPTEDEALDRSVAEVMRRGFRWDCGDVIRVAEVRAYRHSGAG